MNNLGNLGKKSGPTWSREFDLLIRSIGECKSKAEEDAIIAREVDLLKPRLKDAKLDKRSLKEVLVRLTYVEMLGHDASWGHVKALQACSDTNLLTKKVIWCSSICIAWVCNILQMFAVNERTCFTLTLLLYPLTKSKQHCRLPTLLPDCSLTTGAI